jgi:hypothetical protein
MMGEFCTCQLSVITATRMTAVSRQGAKFAKAEPEIIIQDFYGL